MRILFALLIILSPLVVNAQGVKFNGSTQRGVSESGLDAMSGIKKFTISFWAKWTSLTVNDIIVGQWNNGVSSKQWYVMGQHTSASDEIRILIRQASGSNFNEWMTSDFNAVAGVWTHVVVVFDGTQAINDRAFFYKNGVLKTDAKLNGNNVTQTSVGTGQAVEIADATTIAGWEWPGTLDDIRLYTRALTASEVSKIHLSCGRDGIVDGLVGHWRGVNDREPGETLAASQPMKDLSGNGNDIITQNQPTAQETPVGAGSTKGY